MSMWQEGKLKDFIVLQRGHDLTDEQHKNGEYPVVKSNGIDGFHNEYKCKAPGVVTGRSGTIGNVFYIEQDFWPHNTTLYVKDFKGNDKKFVYYLLQVLRFDKYYAGTTVPTLNRNDVHKIKLSVPEPTEQRTIASILSKVDEAIAATKNSIAKAERLKKSLMQNLLTGKLKPDGTFRKEDDFLYDEKVGYYPSEWSCSRFKEFSVLQRGKDLTDNDVISGTIPVVKSNGVQIYHNTFVCEPPGVVTGRSGTIGKTFFIEERYWPHNTTLYVKDFKGNNPKFIFYLIQSMKFERYYAGTTVPTLNRNDIHRIKIAIPSNVDEQKAISDKIVSVENILVTKQTKIKKLERLKKALMQNLLTGKVRVKIKETANG